MHRNKYFKCILYGYGQLGLLAKGNDLGGWISCYVVRLIGCSSGFTDESSIPGQGKIHGCPGLLP